jgi:uncharacterized membrane protein YjgN (DUF898 family)
MQNQEQRFSFTGTGSEYFRIWIVNLLLTIITLGIYSAWAKVKRVQYFYRNTWLNGSSFDYHGSPHAILKGRIIAVVLFGVYNVTMKAAPPVGLAIFALIVAVMPLLVLKSFQFRLHNTSYRGLRFSFVGTLKAAYLNFILYPALAIVSLTLLSPLAQQRIKRYQHSNSRFGQTPFSFSAGVGGFFKIYLLTVLLTILVMAVAAGGVGYVMAHHSAMPAGNDPQQIMKYVAGAYVVLISLMFFVSPYVVSRTQNLIWNNTYLGPHRFTSALQARKLFWIFLSNIVAIILTLGLFKPFADIRFMRYHIESMGLQTDGDVEDFVAEQSQEVSAVGTEVAQIFDFDIDF